MFRAKALDGLRGCAALVVVAQHVMLTYELFAKSALENVSSGNLFIDAFTLSPLHIFWAGTEAVFLFFVISGYAVAKLAQNSKNNLQFYLSRFVRLYLPLLTAIILGLILWQVVLANTPDTSQVGFTGAWTQYVNPAKLDVFQFLRELSLESRGSVIPPVWSLKVEVIFSMLIFVYLRLLKNQSYADTIFYFSVIYFIALLSGSFLVHYLAVFGFGIALALREQKLRSDPWQFFRWKIPALPAEGSVRQGTWAQILGLCLLLSQAHWWRIPFQLDYYVAQLLMMAGIYGIVLCAFYYQAFNKQLTSRVSLWLGKISYSLYLVHAPIILVSIYLWPYNWEVALVAGVISIPVAWLFWAIFERNFHKLASKMRR